MESDNQRDIRDVAAVPCTDPTDPFNADSLKIDQSYLDKLVAKKLLVTVPVKKPNKHHFVRVHPDRSYRQLAWLVELKEEAESEIYLVVPAYAAEIDETLRSFCTLFLAINRQKVPFIWPARMPNPENRMGMVWHATGLEAAEKAMTRWIRVAANKALGAYEIAEAEKQGGEPEWPAMSFYDILRIAFKGKVVDRADHPLIQRLRGAI